MEYDHFWHGWQHSKLGDVYGTDMKIINDQENGWGMRASGKFVKEMGKHDILFGPYMKYWNIDDSETVNFINDGIESEAMEPANTSLEIGGMFGVTF